MTTHATPFIRRGLPTLALVALAPLAGCINDGTGRLTLGPDDGPHLALTAFDPYVIPTEVVALIDAEPALPVHHTEPPSTFSLDRSNWALQQFLVPVDTTTHAPAYRFSLGMGRDTHRETGAFPTNADVLASSTLHPERDWREAPAAPGWAIIEAVSMPVLLFLAPPWERRASPMWSYERTPRVLHVAEYAPIPPEELEEPLTPAAEIPDEQASDVPSRERFVPVDPIPGERVQPRDMQRVEPIPTEPVTPPLPEPEPEPIPDPATPNRGADS